MTVKKENEVMLIVENKTHRPIHFPPVGREYDKQNRPTKDAVTLFLGATTDKELHEKQVASGVKKEDRVLAPVQKLPEWVVEEYRNRFPAFVSMETTRQISVTKA